MLKRKTILVFFILLIIFQIGFFVSSGDPPQEDPELTLIEQLNLLKEEGNLNYVISENEKFITLSLNKGDFEFGGNIISNISEKFLNTIKMDMSGNILEAELYNEEKSKHIINGNEFEIPEGGYLKYGEEEGYRLKKGSKVINLTSDAIIIGENIDFLGEFLLNGGARLDDAGYVLDYGNVIYEGVKITPDFKSAVLIAKDPSFDLSNYRINCIKKSEDSLQIQTNPEQQVNIKFLEGNGFFDMSNENLEGNKEKKLSINIGRGDSIEIFDRPESLKGKLSPMMNHNANKGFTVIKNGRQIFKFKDNEFNTDFGNLNTVNWEASSLDIQSSILPGKILHADDNSKYIINDFEAGNLLSFDTPLNTDFSKKIDSVEGKKLYKWCEEQIGNSAFHWEGRGDICYKLKDGKYVQEKVPTEIQAYDCLGLALVGLTEAVYPDSSLKDFPANLKLIETLEKKGWSSYIVEPKSVAGEIKIKEDIKNIPGGSIAFLMHPHTKGYVPGTKEIDYIGYTNQKNEKIGLLVGHTLVKSANEFGFINAIPGYYKDLIPREAREYNEWLKEKGEQEFFQGAVKIGDLIPREDYLIVIAPPKDQ